MSVVDDAKLASLAGLFLRHVPFCKQAFGNSDSMAAALIEFRNFYYG